MCVCVLVLQCSSRCSIPGQAGKLQLQQLTCNGPCSAPTCPMQHAMHAAPPTPLPLPHSTSSRAQRGPFITSLICFLGDFFFGGGCRLGWLDLVLICPDFSFFFLIDLSMQDGCGQSEVSLEFHSLELECEERTRGWVRHRLGVGSG